MNGGTCHNITNDYTCECQQEYRQARLLCADALHIHMYREGTVSIMLACQTGVSVSTHTTTTPGAHNNLLADKSVS